MFRRTLLCAFISLAWIGPTLAQSAPVADNGKPHGYVSLPLKPTDGEANAALMSAHLLTRFEYAAKPLNQAMSAKIFDAYIKQLDPDKMLFTQADMQALQGYRDTLGEAIWNEDLSAPFDIFNQYLAHTLERIGYARSLLKQDLDLNTDQRMVLNRSTAPWPKDQAELDDLWRQHTTNDWLRLKLAGKNDADIRRILDHRYADDIERTHQLDSQDAFQSFMTAYANSADPHTDYMAEREATEFDIGMKLSLDGIGTTLVSHDEYTQIEHLVPGSPAAVSGKIKPGDYVLAIGQGQDGPLVDITGWRIDDVIALVRGKENTTVRLQITHAGQGPNGEREIVALSRKKVTDEQLSASKRVLDIDQGGIKRRIGVIELPEFYSDFDARVDGDKQFKSASRDVAKLLAELKNDHVQGVVIDLRNNGGGSLYEANALTGLFVGKGPCVQVRDARGGIEAMGNDDAPAITWDGPMDVLVNRGTASASEIFSAAIQDYGRGLIVGSPTFGKGTVQTLIDLNKFAPADDAHQDLGSLKMTTQEFFRVNGGSTQLKGIKPDVAFPADDDAAEYGESTYSNALAWSQIPAAGYQPVGSVQTYLAQITKLHDNRIAKLPAWQLMLDEMAQYNKISQQSTLSLNYATREAERQQLNRINAAFAARDKAIDGSASSLYSNALDDGLDDDERSVSSDLQQDAQAKKAPDPELREAATILFDVIGLGSADRRVGSRV